MKAWIGFLLGFVISYASAQEQLIPLATNPQLAHAAELQAVSARQGPLLLPFYDDFNQQAVYPSEERWVDRDAFVNNNFPILPPTIGVATLDGLDELGQPYSTDDRSFGRADKLTSRVIDLSSLSESDQVYLSFYWQAGGYGEIPEKDKDYLVVEFLDENDVWNEVLKIKAPTQVNDFTQEFIKLEQSFFHEAFQFRFSNFGSLAGSADHWHIDYVVVDKNRNPNFETSASDVSYIHGQGKFFKNYQQMPFKHFQEDWLVDSFSALIQNNFLNVIDIVDNFTIKNLSNQTIIKSYNGPSTDIESLASINYQYPMFDWSGVQPTEDTLVIEVKYHFSSSAENASPDFVRANNELVEHIIFGNTFAYDDGTAERAYRLINFELGKLAVKFNLTTSDTLRAVKIHFPDFPYAPQDPYFNLVVYKALDSTGGQQDEVIYKESFLKKSDFYAPDSTRHHAYSYYKFKPELNDNQGFLVVEDSFYIGLEFEKHNDVDVGFDMNTPSSEYIYYNVGEGWYSSQFQGALMIQAVMGEQIPDFPTSIFERQIKQFLVYPNPATHSLQIDKEIVKGDTYKIYDLSGKLLQQNPLIHSNIDIQSLNSGAYILWLENSLEGWVGQAKFIKK